VWHRLFSQVENASKISAGGPVKVNVMLTRDPDDEEDDEPAVQGVRKVYKLYAFKMLQHCVYLYFLEKVV
jgi:hypothetical protein